MNKHSLIVHISLFFIVLMLTINTLFYFQYQLQDREAKEAFKERFHDAERILHTGHREYLSHEEIEERLYELFEMKILDEFDNIETIQSKQEIHKIRDLTIYQDDTYTYLFHQDRRRGHQIVLYYKNEISKEISTIVFAILLNTLLLAFYLYVFKKLKPLQDLKSKISRFAEGELEVSSVQKGRDEIAEVSNEFNNAISKIKTLQESRNLFLRNIMHELKTPIAKGKLITDLMDDTKNQERLQRIFSRFEYLLGEFTKIEQVTSNAMILEKKRFRVVDILDNAFDILLIESNDVEIEVNANLEIEVDYELMSIALKNLVDNALKYGTKRAKIIVNEDAISIESHGEELENSSFEIAFNRAFEDSSKGLGLGLYITHHIVKKHGFSLNYMHIEGINRFRIA